MPVWGSRPPHTCGFGSGSSPVSPGATWVAAAARPGVPTGAVVTCALAAARDSATPPSAATCARVIRPHQRRARDGRFRGRVRLLVRFRITAGLPLLVPRLWRLRARARSAQVAHALENVEPERSTEGDRERRDSKTGDLEEPPVKVSGARGPT